MMKSSTTRAVLLPVISSALSNGELSLCVPKSRYNLKKLCIGKG